MASRDPKEKADELKMLNTFTKEQLVREIILLRVEIKRKHTMIKNLTTYKQQHENNLQ